MSFELDLIAIGMIEGFVLLGGLAWLRARTRKKKVLRQERMRTLRHTGT